MEGQELKPKKQPKRPKIVQILTAQDGRIGAILYDNGRMFIWKHESAPNPFEASAHEQGYWADGINIGNNQKLQ